jgi:nucleoside-diphosphate-sugar epimerase
VETLPFFRWVKRGLAPVPAGGGGRLSLIHVADLCHLLAGVLTRPPADGVYEVDDGNVNGHSLGEMVAVAAGILGRRARTVGVPRTALTGVASAQQLLARVTGRPAILSPGKVREIFHENWVVTDHRLATALGFEPRFDLQAGFADTIGWYARRGWL